jgi:2-oxoglutarate dehydrogenase E1 component
MTPKSLLRHPLSLARPSDLARGKFRAVLDDGRTAEARSPVRRLVMCSGKVWADLESERRRAQDDSLAIVRIEELYPFPADDLRVILDTYAEAREIVWLQEEPQNAGAWTFVEPCLHELFGAERTIRYVGRPARASPAEGWADVHAAEQRRLIEAALEGQVLSHAS